MAHSVNKTETSSGILLSRLNFSNNDKKYVSFSIETDRHFLNVEDLFEINIPIDQLETHLLTILADINFYKRNLI